MITKCSFCAYYKETPLSLIILEVALDKGLPEEDKILWIKRLAESSGFSDWNGVKIHMGKMHKDKTYFGISPITIWSKKESELIERKTLCSSY